MSELAERAKLQAEKVFEAIGSPHCVPHDEIDGRLADVLSGIMKHQYIEAVAPVIEQALLAERAKVWEEAAKIALSACDELKAFAIGDHVASALRAAAEKEVSNG